MPRRRTLIIVENLTLPVDRRVLQQARALRDAGYTVSVICPKGAGFNTSYELLEGIHVFRHPMPLEASGALGYAVEYSIALFWQFVLAWRVYFKLGFDVIQACNPPDTIFLIGVFFRIFFGKKFIFDHHDVSPELYEAKFGKKGFFYRLLLTLERATFRVADISIATNETFKKIAVERGKMSPDDVYVVQSVPDLTRFKRVEPNDGLRNGNRFVVGYVGIIGEQDGVDLLIEAIHELVINQTRRDLQCVIVGRGTEIENLKDLAKNRGVDHCITFTGYLTDNDLLSALSTFDIGVIPDPKNAFNDKLTMNKLYEYMALGIPFVQFELTQSKILAGDVALYAHDNEPLNLAAQIAILLNDEDLRNRHADLGIKRFDQIANWNSEKTSLLAAYDRVFPNRELEASYVASQRPEIQ